MTDLIELAAIVEKLEGPDRETDVMICRVAGWKVVYDRYDKKPYYEPVKDYSWQPVPAYTESLDAAMTLIERGDEWSVSTIYNIARAEVGINRNHQNAWPGHGEHAGCNPVLALLAACLRARAGKGE